MNYLPDNRQKAMLNATIVQNNGFTPLRPVREFTTEHNLHSKFLQVPDKSRGYNPPNPQAVDNLKFLLRR
jgi:hypothetical protein